jgi:hypothetical protein
VALTGAGRGVAQPAVAVPEKIPQPARGGGALPAVVVGPVLPPGPAAGVCSGDAPPAADMPAELPRPAGVRGDSAAPRRMAFLELFAGRAMLSEAMREAGGFIVISSDLYTDDGEDLRDPNVLARVLDRVEKDVFWVHLAPVCRTYSQARKRAKVLRSTIHPEEHGDDPDLAEADELAKITFAIAERAVQYGVFFSVENPLSSLIWRLRAAVRVAGLRGVKMLELEQCAYGGQHRKATGVLTNASWLPGLRCKDSPDHTHVTLRGRVWSYKDEQDVWYTAEAAEYPWAMCVAWAAAARLAAAGSAVPASLVPAGLNLEAAPRRIVNGIPISEALQARRLEDEACYGGLRDPFLVVQLAPRWQVVGKLLSAIIDRVLLDHSMVLAEVAALAGPHRADSRIAEVVSAAAEDVRTRAAAAFGARSVKLSAGGYCADLVRAITAKAADPDIDVAGWMEGHTPLGVNATVQPRGVFPGAPPGAAALAAKEFYDLNLRKGWKHSNYASFDDHKVLAHGEVERLTKAGFLERIGPAWSTVTARWPNAICTRLACLVRPGAGGALKIRLIVDMRRSGVNGIAKITERIVLPRPGDAVEAIRHCMGADSRGELMKADFADAFLSLGVLEAERGMVVVTDGVEYYAYRGVPFGLGPAVVIWGRVAAWLSRCAQACIFGRGRLATYVDDPLIVATGSPADRTRTFAHTLLTWAAVGAPLSWKKISRGARLEWCGIVFSIEPDRIRTTIEVNRIQAIKTEILRMLAAKGIVTRVQQLAGLLSWVAGIVPRLRPFVRPLWAAIAASGAPRAHRHGGSLPAGAAFVGQVRRALQWILRWLEVAATPRLDRQFPLLGREQRPRFIIRTDASTTGMGAILFDAQTLEPVNFWADSITAQDEQVWRAEKGISGHMALWELLTLVVSVRIWAPFLRGDLAEVRVQADSMPALGAAVKMTSPTPVLNELAMELALALESIGAEVAVGEHIRGVLNVEADALSRLWEGAELPARLRCVRRTTAPSRQETWYHALCFGRADKVSTDPAEAY